MSKAELTPSAIVALAKLRELLENRAFNGEIRLVVAQGGVRTFSVTEQIKC